LNDGLLFFIKPIIQKKISSFQIATFGNFMGKKLSNSSMNEINIEPKKKFHKKFDPPIST
jgi:hypothetical protein